MIRGLEARGIGVVRGGRQILFDVDVTIAPTTFTAIVGPNGSGKSTLLRTLAGLSPAASGHVTLNDRRLEDYSRRAVARHLAFLPQDNRCDFAFTVEEMIAMGRHPHRRRFAPASDHDRAVVRAVSEICDLDHLAGRTVDRLSGGEHQRVAIARCLAAEPDIVLLDEPTAHLDLDHSMRLLGLCRDLAVAGRAVVVATHDLSAISRFATHAVVLNGGRVVASGVARDVLTPAVCREVFAVEVEIVTTAAGEQAFVFSAVPRDS